jgi:hypothetical protein
VICFSKWLELTKINDRMFGMERMCFEEYVASWHSYTTEKHWNIQFCSPHHRIALGRSRGLLWRLVSLNRGASYDIAPARGPSSRYAEMRDIKASMVSRRIAPKPYPFNGADLERDRYRSRDDKTMRGRSRTVHGRLGDQLSKHLS